MPKFVTSIGLQKAEKGKNRQMQLAELEYKHSRMKVYQSGNPALRDELAALGHFPIQNLEKIKSS